VGHRVASTGKLTTFFWKTIHGNKAAFSGGKESGLEFAQTGNKKSAIQLSEDQVCYAWRIYFMDVWIHEFACMAIHLPKYLPEDTHKFIRFHPLSKPIIPKCSVLTIV
jgi:hypothetical protein